MNYDEQLKSATDMLRARGREQLLEHGEAILTFALLVTCDPRTGAPLGPMGIGLMLLLCPVVLGEEGKDRITMTAKAVAIAGKAVACVTAMDAWMSMPAKGEKLVQPSQHPDRMEALVILTERSDGRSSIERTVYRRDQGQIMFDEADRATPDDMSMHGRFVILPAFKPDPDLVAAMRGFVRAHDGFLWERVS